MNTRSRRTDGAAWINVTHHSFYISAADAQHVGVGAPTRPTNGLVDPVGDALRVRTGIHTGPVTVDLQPHTHAPPVDIEEWDDVVEVLYDAPARCGISVLMDDVPPDLPVLNPSGPGLHRVRVHARGRDTDVDGTVFEPVENYLIQMWPSDNADEAILKATDAYGRSLRTGH
jgi:hypothetical protein